MKGKTKTNLNEIATLSNWVKTQTGRSKLRVRFDPAAEGPYTTKDCIVMPTFNNNMTEDDVTKIRAFVLHECLHHTEGPECFKVADDNKITVDSPLALMYNIVEDERIERSGARKYRGDREIISNGRDLLMDQNNKLIKERFAGKPTNETQDLLLATFTGTHVAASDWDWAAAKHVRTEYDLLPASAKKVLKNITDKIDLSDAFDKLGDEYDAWELAKQMYEAAGNDLQKELDRMKAAAKSGTQVVGSASGKDPTEAPGKGDPTDGDGKPIDGRSDAEKALREFREILSDDHSDQTSTTSVTLDYKNYKGSGIWSPLDPSKVIVIDYSKGDTLRGGYGFGGSFKHVLNSIGEAGTESNISALASRVKRLLTIKAQAFYAGGYRNGRLHNKNLWRVGMPLVGNGEWNSKVFKKKQMDDVLDSAVTICIDFSGSMGGPKLGHAGIAALMLNECISRSLRVPVEVITYSSGEHQYPSLGLIKKFDERLDYSTIVERLDDSSKRMAENPDADALLWANARLQARREKRKVLIVLSDGQPTVAWRDGINLGGDCIRALKDTVKMIEDTPHTKAYGIGIIHDGVKSIFKQHITIKRSDELESTILNLINKEFVS